MYSITGFSTCPYCIQAKELLTSEGLPFEFIAIEEPEARKAWMDAQGFVAPNRTFPKIWEDGNYIGGKDDLEKHLLNKLMNS